MRSCNVSRGIDPYPIAIRAAVVKRSGHASGRLLYPVLRFVAEQAGYAAHRHRPTQANCRNVADRAAGLPVGSFPPQAGPASSPPQPNAISRQSVPAYVASSVCLSSSKRSTAIPQGGPLSAEMRIEELHQTTAVDLGQASDVGPYGTVGRPSLGPVAVIVASHSRGCLYRLDFRSLPISRTRNGSRSQVELTIRWSAVPAT